jgi:hypothetical protein
MHPWRPSTSSASRPRRLRAILFGVAGPAAIVHPVSTRNSFARRSHAGRASPGWWLHLPRGALPHDGRAAVRALLPLPLVPARDRHGLRAERDDRGRSGRPAAGRAGACRHALEQRQGPKNPSLPQVQDRAVEPLCRGGRAGLLRAGRHPRRAGPAATRHPHLHVLQAALGAAAAGRARGARILRPQGLLAACEPRAPRGHARPAQSGGPTTRRSRRGRAPEAPPPRAAAPGPSCAG